MFVSITETERCTFVTGKITESMQMLNADLTFSSSFGSRGSGDGQFNYPWDVALDSTGNVYVAVSEAHHIRVFTEEGKFLRRFGNRRAVVMENWTGPPVLARL